MGNWNKRKTTKEYEAEIAKKWMDEKTFEKSIENRDASKSYVFYDGPPFITGVPHHGTLLSSIVKDAVPRYWTMKGFRVERQWGWDSHGLPAENFTEKILGIVDRRQILTDEKHRFEFRENDARFDGISRKDYEESAKKMAPKNAKGESLPTFSLEKYITSARDAMVDNSATWKPVIDRVGRWVNFDGAYKTMDKDFMESVWWAFAKLYKAGKIYEGAKVLMYDTHFATPVAKAEVTMDNDAYQTVTDPSIFVKFALKNADNFAKKVGENEEIFALAWTTTPWTLPGNTALAVNEKMEYVLAKVDGENLIVAKELFEKVFAKNEEREILTEFLGAELIGLNYEPLFKNEIFASAETNYYQSKVENFAKIWNADYVSAESGTGIVHIAPIYGEEDYELAKKFQIPARETMDENGYYWPEISLKLNELFMEALGQAEPENRENYHEILKKADVKIDQNGNFEVFSANKMIAKALSKIGAAWKIEMIRHEYPFNPRSKQRIMYRAIPSWFFDVQGQKPMMLAQNENVNWFPAHLKNGRFHKNIEQAPDWNLSRNRFWASAMPVWKGDKGTVHVVESYTELYELSGVKLDDYHRPWVDDISFATDEISAEIREKYNFAGQPGEKFTRIEEVLDGWFESGSMPFAQMHYPFENREKFEQNYPADFIVEYIGQVRAWFYYVHLVNSSLAEVGAFGEAKKSGDLNAYKNVITTGIVAGNDGRKMSKSLGNFTDPNELMDQFSADSLRFLLLSSPLLSGEDFALKDKNVSDISRKLNMIWNVYDFFAMYAEIENFKMDFEKYPAEGETANEKIVNYAKNFTPEKMENILDKWIISRFAELHENISRNMDAYNIPEAMSEILPFLDDLSNWFLRRSRRRFAKNPHAKNKHEVFSVLHFVLMETAVILAPFTPFISEQLFANLTNGELGESVHLLDWPENFAKDEAILAEMSAFREIIQEGLRQRMQNDEFGQQKIRQPLAKISYGGVEFPTSYNEIVAEEVNVKEVFFDKNLGAGEVILDKVLTDELREEGAVRELIRAIQGLRKTAKLSVDDAIDLRIEINAELAITVEKFRELIETETQSKDFANEKNGSADPKTESKNYAEATAKVNGQEIKISLSKR